MRLEYIQAYMIVSLVLIVSNIDRVCFCLGSSSMLSRKSYSRAHAERVAMDIHGMASVDSSSFKPSHLV